jgi:hypothetical protein
MGLGELAGGKYGETDESETRKIDTAINASAMESADI